MARWRLRDIAEPERWNARMLAQATGLADNTWCCIWTNTTRRADLATLDNLAAVLTVQPNDLLGPGTQPPSRAGRAAG